ncbi:hypothetical protein PGB90_001364 [Kerria lacca]
MTEKCFPFFLFIEIFCTCVNVYAINISKLNINQTKHTFTNESALIFDSETILNNSFEDECSNEYCLSEDEYMDLIIEHIYPNPFEWLLVGMHLITFVVGLVGNALVCIAVYKNRAMRNVTNYFIVNLAVADFMVLLFCLPATVLWDITETWFMGNLLCKIVLYFQRTKIKGIVLMK